jgi:hypothetical protein
MFPHRYRTLEEIVEVPAGSPMPYAQRELGLTLFDLKADPGETRDVATDFPDVVARLQASADQARTLFGDQLLGVKGNSIRGPARLSD